jgi:hypothetical protein
VIEIKGKCDMDTLHNNIEKNRTYTLPVMALIIFGFGGLTTAGLMFGAVIVIGSFVCNMCLATLFVANGIVTTLLSLIKIHDIYEDDGCFTKRVPTEEARKKRPSGLFWRWRVDSEIESESRRLIGRKR